MNENSGVDCFICRKHRGEVEVPGGVILEDELLYVGHASIPENETTIYLGELLIEPKRHIAGLPDLNAQEAERVGPLITKLSQALVHTVGAEHIYLFVFGHHVDHLHIWLVPRYPGTPREYWGIRVDEWPGAPRGGTQVVADLCQRLRESLAGEI